MIHGSVNVEMPLFIFVPDGTTTLFPRITISDADGTLAGVVYPTSMGQGLYAVKWTPTVEGYFSLIYEFFIDSGYVTMADYDRDADSLEVDSHKADLARLLGLNHENALLDQQVYGSNGRLTSARLRSYDSKANAQVAGSTGLLYTWTVLATYDSQNRSQTFQILHEP